VNLKYYLIIIVCLFYKQLMGIKPPVEKQAIIVHFAKSVQMDDLQSVCNEMFINAEFLNFEKTLWKLEFNPRHFPSYVVLNQLKKVSDILSSQEDGLVQLRSTTPNDPFLSSQWHLNAIKAINSWDLSKGGVNKNGDTIVVAVVDDGLHINHPDFQGNIWINKDEIPNNLIDDDNNGYVDDVYGWNFMGQDNDISDSINYNASHGTPVAGIIGAKGNNQTGICGINWHVKLMIVNIADTAGNNMNTYQSDVVRAYSYILHQRKLYNQTNGARGAFVVVTNSSWGVDKKFPYQAPLWCAMYDSLGKYGIMNVVAVTNSTENVDVYGDLPTLCSSDALITVGSTTTSDQYFNCGYSTTSVDLSAPGANIFSSRAYTSQNINGNQIYRNGHNGTSFAAPMVAGAIGLLNSFTCDKFDELMKNDPIRANMLMKRFVLEGADVIPSLEGKSLTAARLNIYNSMRLMTLFCFDELSFEKISKESKLLFPNPGVGIVNLGFDCLETNTQVEVFSAEGKRIDIQIVNNQIDISKHLPGVYYIRFSSPSSNFNIKYVLMNQ
jgi:hypothetical protein